MGVATAGSTAAVNRAYHKWFSPALERDMELLVFGHAGARMIVFPTRCGRFYDYENFGLVDALTHHIQNGWLQLYCVDSIDAESIYSTCLPPYIRIRRHADYEKYVVNEVIPFSRTQNEHPALLVHGCSLGAYHAINLAFRFPHLVAKVIALSGRFDLTAPLGDFRGLFDGYFDDLVYFHTPSHFVKNIHDPSLLDAMRRMDIVIAVGRADPFFDNNQEFSDLLNAKGIPHRFYIWDGRAHKPAYWQKMIAMYV